MTGLRVLEHGAHFPILLVILSKLLGYLEQRFASVFKANVPAAVLKPSLI